MNSTPMQSTQPVAVIHRTANIHAAQYKAENAFDAALGAAWDNGSRGIDGSDRERHYRSAALAALAELVSLALGVEDGAR